MKLVQQLKTNGDIFFFAWENKYLICISDVWEIFTIQTFQGIVDILQFHCALCGNVLDLKDRSNKPNLTSMLLTVLTLTCAAHPKLKSENEDLGILWQ